MSFYFDEFRHNLKYYREKKGWTQAHLAIEASSSNGMIGNIESGKAEPSMENIFRLAAALGVHPADLFLRDISKNKDWEILGKYHDTILYLDVIPAKEREPIEHMIVEIGKKYK